MNDFDKKQLAFLLTMNQRELHEYLNGCDDSELVYNLMLIAKHTDQWSNKSVPRVKVRPKEDLSLAKEYLKKFMLEKR